MNKFEFPPHYSWPFFFTIQEYSETRQRQLEMWADLILDYHKAKGIWKLTKTEFLAGIGRNEAVNRVLSSDDVTIVFDYLILKKKAMFSPISKGVLFLLWRSTEEWESFIYEAVVKQQKLDSLETLDFIVNDEENQFEEFYGMDKEMLIVILKNLENKEKCKLIKNDEGEFIAVKFK